MDKSKLITIAQKLDRLLEAGELSEAADGLADQILSHNRSAGCAYKGVIALKRGRLDEAERLLLEGYRLNGKQHLALANLLPTYIKKRDFKRAVAYGEQAIKVMPQNRSVVVNYAGALIQEQRYNEALELLEPLFDPDKPDLGLWTALISAYRSGFRRDEAQRVLDLAKKHFPEHHAILRLDADSMAEVTPAAALKAFRKALDAEPGNIPTIWNMSLVQLRLGEFDEGWRNYDAGLEPEVGKIGRPLPTMFEGLPRYLDPNTIPKDRTILVVCEQGIGDQVLFFGAFAQFVSEFSSVALICEKRMAAILQRSFPTVQVYTFGFGPIAAVNQRVVSGYIPLGSIQKAYRSSHQAFLKHRVAYLVPDKERVSKFKARLGAAVGGRRVIGFSWKGGFWERSQKTKTLDIEYWDALFESCPEDIFVCLQYGDVEKEKTYLTSKFKNVRFIEGVDFKKDLDSWFALACACERIISVSTALVHFAGAAGVPVGVLMSAKGSPFIWGLDEGPSIAYPSVLRYRQEAGESLVDFFQRASAYLRDPVE